MQQLFKQRITAFIFTLSLLLMVSCSSSTGSGASTDPQQLASTRWAVDSFDGKALLANSTISLEFDAAKNVTGNAGCNNYQGSSQFDGNKVNINIISVSRMLCGEVDQQESEYLDALQSINRWKLENSKLILSVGNTPRLVLRSP